MTTLKQFRDLPEQIETFETILRSALESLVDDLSDAPWFIREREVVNMFVFRHLVRKFQGQELDISQIGIEYPVRVIPEGENGRSRVYADIVVWPHSKATIWRTCKPLARIEWKNISCRESHPSELNRQYREDISHLEKNSRFAVLNYAVLTKRRDGHVELQCVRISEGADNQPFFEKHCDGTGDEAPYQAELDSVVGRPLDCSECSSR